MIKQPKTCDICGKEFEARHNDFGNGMLAPLYSDSYVRVRKVFDHGIGIASFNSCPDCTQKICDYIDSIKKENEK